MKVCKRMCNECPFANDSAPGWLGPSTVADTLDTQNFELPFSCHKTRDDDTGYPEIAKGLYPVCRGWLLSATKSCKQFGRNPYYGEALAQLQQENPLTEQDRDRVMDQREFRAHHQKENWRL
jgi:hypothetical protein